MTDFFILHLTVHRRAGSGGVPSGTGHALRELYVCSNDGDLYDCKASSCSSSGAGWVQIK